MKGQRGLHGLFLGVAGMVFVVAGVAGFGFADSSDGKCRLRIEQTCPDPASPWVVTGSQCWDDGCGNPDWTCWCTPVQLSVQVLVPDGPHAGQPATCSTCACKCLHFEGEVLVVTMDGDPGDPDCKGDQYNDPVSGAWWWADCAGNCPPQSNHCEWTKDNEPGTPTRRTGYCDCR